MLTSLIENLKEVKDFRKNQGKRYSLWEVLLVVVLGVMSGHQGYREMEYFVKANEVILKRTFNIYSQGMPSYSTIRRVMRGVDEKDLSKIVKEWSRENSPKLKSYKETVYYISSIWEKADFFSQKIKGHWGIENQVHWVKDVLFKEDSMKIHQVQAATNWALLNTLGLNIFRGLGFLSITEGRRWLGNHWDKLLAIS
ncbi:ISAs1 family transposase [Planktothrix prolifica]|uniref:ISAs1 family transposase n=1 Tax=Planktothrix prolifica TaxID=54307 RepID=UPI0008FF0031|nr:ISAs1 family transposase [Planktothrix prolifica]